MSMTEQSEGMAPEKLCPKCGAPLENNLENNAEVTPGTLICGVCGAELPQPGAIAGNDGLNNDLNGPAPQPVAGGGRNPLALVVVAVIAAGMLFFGLRMTRRSGPTHPLGLASATNAPDFTLESLDGKSTRLSDFRGKAVLLNFWATWCGPCKIETPWLVELQNEYGSQGFQVVGVAMDDSGKEDIAKFAKDMGVNYPVLLGKEAVGDAYGGVPALPETFFISRDGKIVDKIIGLRGRADMEDAIKKTLNTQAGTSQTAAVPAPPVQAQK